MKAYFNSYARVNSQPTAADKLREFKKATQHFRNNYRGLSFEAFDAEMRKDAFYRVHLFGLFKAKTEHESKRPFEEQDQRVGTTNDLAERERRHFYKIINPVESDLEKEIPGFVCVGHSFMAGVAVFRKMAAPFNECHLRNAMEDMSVPMMLNRSNLAFDMKVENHKGEYKILYGMHLPSKYMQTVKKVEAGKYSYFNEHAEHADLPLVLGELEVNLMLISNVLMY